MSTRLLLADDSHTIQKVVGMIFPPGEYELTYVTSGSDLLETARRTSPGIILLDTHLGDASGLELCRSLRQFPETSSIPVLFLCGAFEQFDEDAARAAGGDDFIVKPFEAQQLIDKVNALLSTPRSAAAAPSPGIDPFAPLPEERRGITSLDFSFTPPQGEIEPASLDIFSPPLDPVTPLEPAAGGMASALPEPEISPFEATSLVEPSPLVPGGEPADFLSQAFEAPAADFFAESWTPEPSAAGTAPSFVQDAPVDETVSAALFSAASEPAATPFLEEPVGAPPPVEPPPASAPIPGEITLSEAQMEQIVSRISRDIIERIAWEVVPDLAEIMIREEIRKIKEG